MSDLNLRSLRNMLSNAAQKDIDALVDALPPDELRPFLKQFLFALGEMWRSPQQPRITRLG